MNPVGTTPLKRRATVLGTEVAYLEAGVGEPIVLLYGNPTPSYLWRGVLAHLSGIGRCIAPDLVGMGDSAAPPEGPDRYTFVDHRRYLDALLDGLGVREPVTLVVHDWGSALGFDWANRHRGQVKCIAYLEAIVRPMRWAERDDTFRSVFRALRSAAGERMVLDENFFVDGYAHWLSECDVPKLFIKGEPGTTLRDDDRVKFCPQLAQPGRSRRARTALPAGGLTCGDRASRSSLARRDRRPGTRVAAPGPARVLSCRVRPSTQPKPRTVPDRRPAAAALVVSARGSAARRCSPLDLSPAGSLVVVGGAISHVDTAIEINRPVDPRIEAQAAPRSRSGAA